MELITEITDELVEKIEEHLESKHSIELAPKDSDEIRDVLDAVIDRKMEEG